MNPPPRELGHGKLRRKFRPDGSHYWEFDYPDATGRRRVVRLGANKAMANRRAAALIRDRDLALVGLGTLEARDTPFEELLPEFLAQAAMEAKPKSVEQMGRSIRRILGDLRVQRVGDVTLRAVLAWRERRRKAAAASTVNADVGHLSRFLRWCVPDILAVNPLAEMPRLKNKVSRPRRALTEDEILRLLRAARRLDEVNADHHAADRTIAAGTKGRAWNQRSRVTPFPRGLMVRFLLKTGCRFSEATNLVWANVRLEHGHLQFVDTKNGTTRVLPVDGQLVELLEEVRSAAYATLERMPSSSDHVLLTPMGKPWTRGGATNFRKWLLDAYEAAGIPRIDQNGERIDVHALRHTWATRLLRAGQPIQFVQRLGGWKTLKVLLDLYNHITAMDALTTLESVPLPRVDDPDECDPEGYLQSPASEGDVGERRESAQHRSRKAVGDGTPGWIRTSDRPLRSGESPEKADKGGEGQEESEERQ